jgi:hypothetical protein
MFQFICLVEVTEKDRVLGTVYVYGIVDGHW